MHVANCEYLLLSISCKMNAHQSLFVVDLNERRGDRTYLVWSITQVLCKIQLAFNLKGSKLKVTKIEFALKVVFQ